MRNLFINYFIDEIKNHYNDFSSRSTRKQYWMFTLFYVIFFFLLLLIDNLLGVYDKTAEVGLFSTIYTLGLLLPYFGILARRLHDAGYSAWWMLLLLIPFGPLIILIFTLLDSEKLENKYGISPKYANDEITETLML